MAIESTDQDRFILVVAKLLELTQQKKLRWSTDPATSDPLGTPEAEREVRNAYMAHYEGRRLRIYEKLVPINSLRRLATGQRETLKVWRPVLELSESSGQGWWPFPKLDSIADLMRAVQYQVSGVDDFVERVLKR